MIFSSKILNNSSDLKNQIIEIISKASIAIMEIYSKSDLGINLKKDNNGEYNINEFSQKKVEHIFSIFFWNSIRLEHQLYQILNQLWLQDLSMLQL